METKQLEIEKQTEFFTKYLEDMFRTGKHKTGKRLPGERGMYEIQRIERNRTEDTNLECL